jgi:hypothetical protein
LRFVAPGRVRHAGLSGSIDDLLVHDTIGDGDRAFIEARDMFFLATADADGRPTCPYKGGDPGDRDVLGR